MTAPGFIFPNSKPEDRKERKLQRALEMLPAIITWTFLVVSFALSFLLPAAIAIFIIIFDIYWLVKVFYITAFMIFGYRRMRLWGKDDWLAKCRKLSESTQPEVLKDWRQLYHVVILPTYKEGLEILQPSLDAIVNCDYPKDRMILVMAFEERAGEPAKERAKLLEEKYADKFYGYVTTFHPDGIAGEAKVKGANTSWAGEEARVFLEEKGIDLSCVIVSTFDSDTCVHPKYFSCLTHRFMVNPKRHQSSYQPLPLYNNNIWQTNSVVRVIMVTSSFWQLTQSVRRDKMVTFSSHSMSFKTLVEVGYWPRDVISDDSIIFWKGFMLFHGDYAVEPIYLPVSLDAVLAENYSKTVWNQYKQQRRWAWGIENIPIVYRALWRDPRISLGKKISKSWEEFIGRISWGVSPIIIALFGWLPIWFGGEAFNQTVLALNLPKVLGYLMTFAMIGLFVSIFTSLYLLPPAPAGTSRWKKAMMVFQWFLSPLVAIPLGAFPMIDAQTRMFFGKYMEFWVTEKIRRG
jgi:cellulose synthase/poly-beta-1,6-N-acetylglucosamine synthase-like glycosyltransferase